MSLFHHQKTYDIIYSLGPTCAAATYLNRHHLRTTSGPLDWCGDAGGKGSIEERVRQVRTHFADALQLKNLHTTEMPFDSIHDDHCALYIDEATHFYLPHDFLADRPIEETFEKVKAKYTRRIKRFYENINAAEKVLLVWVAYGSINTYNDEELKQQSRLMCDALGKTVDFLFILNDDSMGLDEPAVKQELLPNVDKWRANIRRKDTGAPLDYLGARHLVDPIFRGYALRGTQWLETKAAIRSVFGRVISAFIPVRSWRKKVRARFIYNEFNQDSSRDVKNAIGGTPRT